MYYMRERGKLQERGKLHATMGSYCGFQSGVVVG